MNNKYLHPIRFILKKPRQIKKTNEVSSLWRRPESSYFNKFWTPAFAGVTFELLFYDVLNCETVSGHREMSSLS